MDGKQTATKLVGAHLIPDKVIHQSGSSGGLTYFPALFIEVVREDDGSGYEAQVYYASSGTPLYPVPLRSTLRGPVKHFWTRFTPAQPPAELLEPDRTDGQG